MQELTIYLASPRGFCAGVTNAIKIVNDTLLQYGAPVYVRHEIVHNKHIINELKSKGVIFIEDFQEITDKSRPVIISAHGVGEPIFNEALELGLILIDATCPLVKKVHKHIRQYASYENEIIVIGKKNHIEVIGTIGQIPQYKKIYHISNITEAKDLKIIDPKKVSFVTQTTLSVDETKEITDYLIKTYPDISYQKDICFATTQRQSAIKKLASLTNNIIVVGSQNSSNSKSLQKTAILAGATNTILIDDSSEINWTDYKSVDSIGITAGASAPEHLIEEILKEAQNCYKKINILNVKI